MTCVESGGVVVLAQVADAPRVKVLIVLMLVVGTVIVVVAGIVGASEREPRVWTIDWGETLTLPPGRLHPDDVFQCKNGAGVGGVPAPGTGVGNSLGMSVTTAADGTLTATCDANSEGAQL
jgi:hypothetical protein